MATTEGISNILGCEEILLFKKTVGMFSAVYVVGDYDRSISVRGSICSESP